MNAKEAKELANRNIEPKIDFLMQLITNKIKGNAKEGRFNITFLLIDYSDIVIDKVKNKISTLGYKISLEENLHDEKYFNISWE